MQNEEQNPGTPGPEPGQKPGHDPGYEPGNEGHRAISIRSALWNIASDLELLLETGEANPENRSPLPPAPSPERTGPAENNPGPGVIEGPAPTLDALHQQILECRACSLHRERTHAVPGEGDTHGTRLMVIGEGPGAEEDARGLPFVGKAGKYLDKWLSAIDLSREDGVFITNTVKCRPPANRDPRPEETSACLPYLYSQIRMLKPRAILCVGRISASILLDRDVKITKERGKWFRFMDIPLMATFHPSAVLRNPDLRRPVWEDMKKLKHALDSGNFSDQP
ncbi:uracil-DNA glycosylase [Salinispira pacifica]|uniref:Type-4 uracil-DNA glycosylase n=1 Tax=Salinispira pacifica TaxID=1307761 RepID=V5WJM1_9SPIO|nr:uracil-DNA glycosylase [Salinispira pacifica]AHC15764.1 Uracil-DNA glycosylase, family 4 [Salinispira pacifica]